MSTAKSNLECNLEHNTEAKYSTPNWRKIIRKYNKANASKANWQLITTMGLYVGSWFLAYQAYQISVWLCLLVAVAAQVFYGRIFILMHDCGHGSFYKSKKANTFWGVLMGITWFTPPFYSLVFD